MSIVTLAEVKIHLKINSTDTQFDILLNQLIPQLSKEVETWTKRKIESDNYYELYDGNNEKSLLLNNAPVISVGVLSQSVDLSNQTYTDAMEGLTDYLIDKPAGIIELVYNLFYKSQRSVYIEYVSGYAASDIPQDLRLICLDMIGKKFFDQENKRFGIVQKNITGENVTFSYEDMTKNQKNILNRYKLSPYAEGIRLDAKYTAE